MRTFLVLALSVIMVSSATASVAATRNRHRLRNYGKSLVRRDAALGIVGSAAIGQARNRPHEWGQGAGGFATRVGSGAAHYVVKDTIERGVGGILHEDRNSFVRANRPGFGPKFKAAAESTFTVRHKHSNKRYAAAGRLSGDFGSGMISRAWQPAALHTASSGLATGGVSLGADFGWNLARQYMPAHRGRRVAHVHRTERRYTRRG